MRMVAIAWRRIHTVTGGSEGGEGDYSFHVASSPLVRVSLSCVNGKRFTPLVNATEGEVRVRDGGRNVVVAARLQPHTGPSSRCPARGKNL
ncbi:hypothetical protein R1flu_019335 [Riccia fluitans]|uniref:Uncharacterized protein n=1 Tax=Riccia fluitans TaxID=41844 RepID=A0ABD1ZIQ0_9MARC